MYYTLKKWHSVHCKRRRKLLNKDSNENIEEQMNERPQERKKKKE